MKFINFISSDSADIQRISIADTELVEVGAAYERIIQPAAAGAVATVRSGTGYTAAGSVGAKLSVIEFADEGVHIAALFVCLHSRVAAGAWRRLTLAAVGGQFFSVPMPPAPWAALRYDADAAVQPLWLEQFAKTLSISIALHA